MDQTSHIYENILDNMSDGVMTVDLRGQIITFNPAAARILALEREEGLDRMFAEVFLDWEGMDEFAQTVLDAVYEASVCHQRVVHVHTGSALLSLALTTSYLQTIQDRTVQKIGVIAVFGDITEVQALREAEPRLVKALQAKQAELQEVSRRLEASDRALQAALQKMRVVRVVVPIFVGGLLLAVGWCVYLKP